MNSVGESGILVLPHFIQILVQMWHPFKSFSHSLPLPVNSSDLLISLSPCLTTFFFLHLSLSENVSNIYLFTSLSVSPTWQWAHKWRAFSWLAAVFPEPQCPAYGTSSTHICWKNKRMNERWVLGLQFAAMEGWGLTLHVRLQRLSLAKTLKSLVSWPD